MTYVIIYKKQLAIITRKRGDTVTSVKRRLDHVLNELDTIGTESDEVTAKNVIAELKVIKSAYKETKHAPMCCFRYDAQQRIVCDVTGPLDHEQFMEKCKQCQAQIKKVLINLNTD
jgi:hypothetical protein